MGPLVDSPLSVALRGSEETGDKEENRMRTRTEEGRKQFAKGHTCGEIFRDGSKAMLLAVHQIRHEVGKLVVELREREKDIIQQINYD